MNTLIAAVIGAAIAAVTLVGGVNAVQSGPQKVDSEQLYSYADR